MEDKRDERELSKSEKERLEKHNIECENLINKGYEKHNLTVNANKGLVIGSGLGAFVAAIFVIIFYLINSFDVFKGEGTVLTPLFLLILIITGTVVHEGIHGFTWGLFSENHFKDIYFGVIWKNFTPYCTCQKPLKKYQYIMGSVMPCMILGVIPIIISIILNSPSLLVYGAFQISFAGGDLLVLSFILKNKSTKKEKLYYDHPTEIGLILFDK